MVVPAFHSVAHIASCQFEFHPRTVELAGMFDYEQTERLWALINVLVKRTRNVFNFKLDDKSKKN